MKDISTVCYQQDEVMALDAPMLSSPASRQHETAYSKNHFRQHDPTPPFLLHPSFPNRHPHHQQQHHHHHHSHYNHLHHHHHQQATATAAVVRSPVTDVAGGYYNTLSPAPARCPPAIPGGGALTPCPTACKKSRWDPSSPPSSTTESSAGMFASSSPTRTSLSSIATATAPPAASRREEQRSSLSNNKFVPSVSPTARQGGGRTSSFSSPCGSSAFISPTSPVELYPATAGAGAAAAATAAASSSSGLNLGKYAAVVKTEVDTFGQCEGASLSFLVPSPSPSSPCSAPTSSSLPCSAPSPLSLSTPVASPLSTSSTSNTPLLGTMVVKSERPSSPYGESSPTIPSYHHHHHHHHLFLSPSSTSTSPSAGAGGECSSAQTASPSSSPYFPHGRNDKPPSTLMSTLRSTPSPPPPSSNLPPLFGLGGGTDGGSPSSTQSSPASVSSMGPTRGRKKDLSETGGSGTAGINPGTVLPPCRICLDKASGFHYGLNTCEACKGFFRRSLKKGTSYVCTREGKCEVTGDRRNSCGFCRYQKCIKLGMSRTAIKTGRYTHAKRTQDTLEIKKLMEPATAKEDEDIDLDGAIAHIVYWHDKHVICSTKKPKTFIEEQLQKKKDEMRLQKDLFGETSVSSDQHQEFLELTGMHIDNRETLMNVHVSNSDRWIRGYIEFAKQVPGFRNLTLADQARLIKYARIEFWFLGSFPGYHSELDLAVMPNGRCFTRKEMYTVWREKYIDVSFDLSVTLKKLKVTPDEMIVIKTICLTAGDRCKFDEPQNVAKLQWRLIRCLEHLLRKRITSHTEFVNTFSQVFSCLTDLRNLNEAEYQTIQNSQLYEKFSKNDLIMEVLPY